MAKGRPPELVFDPAHLGPVAQAAVTVDERGRIQLPRKIVSPLTWIEKTPTEALAVLAEPGVVRFHSWKDAAPVVLEKRSQLIDRARTEPAALELLRLLEDRYKRFQIPTGARPTLTSEMILHLKLPSDQESSIFVWRIENVLELNSIEFRNSNRNIEELDELADLPA